MSLRDYPFCALDRPPSGSKSLRDVKRGFRRKTRQAEKRSLDLEDLEDLEVSVLEERIRETSGIDTLVFRREAENLLLKK